MTDSRKRQCVECGAVYSNAGKEGAGRPRKKFCSAKCNKKFNNRRRLRGAVLYDLAMCWRKEREKGSFGDMCHQISLYLQQDLEDGRVTFNNYRGETIPYHIPANDNIKEKLCQIKTQDIS